MPKPQQHVIDDILSNSTKGLSNYTQGQFYLAVTAIQPLLKMWEGAYLSIPDNPKRKSLNDNNRPSHKIDSWSCSTYITTRKGNINSIISYLHDSDPPFIIQASKDFSQHSLEQVTGKIKKLISVEEFKPYIKVNQDIQNLFRVVTTIGTPASADKLTAQKQTLLNDLKRFPMQHCLYINEHFFNVLAAIIAWDDPKGSAAKAFRILLFDASVQGGIKRFLAETRKILNSHGESYYHGLLVNDHSRDKLRKCCLQGAIKAARLSGVPPAIIEEILEKHRIHYDKVKASPTINRKRNQQHTPNRPAKSLYSNIRPLNTEDCLNFVFDIHKMVEVPSRYRRQKLWIIGSLFSLISGTTLTVLMVPTLLAAIPNLSAFPLYSTLAGMLLITAIFTGFCTGKAIKNQPSKRLLSQFGTSAAPNPNSETLTL